MNGMAARRLLGLLIAAVVAVGLVSAASPGASAAPSTPPTPVVTPSQTAALARDAPDPDVVRAGSTFYAFTTGTTWGNQIGIAATTSANPQAGWRTLGSAFRENGATAPPAAWERNNTPTSPGVIQVGGRWVMFYDAVVDSSGVYCLTVATSPTVTGPYTDSSHGPFECQPSLGGSIDPQPFLDPQTGRAYLLWKNNAGGSKAPSQIWSAPLTADGLGLAAAPTAIFTIASHTYSWQTTTDNPSMVFAGGHYSLLFTGGNYLSNYYPVGYVLCSGGPRGGCDQDEPGDPILSGYGGTGGGNEFTDAAGRWWITYQTWKPSGCTHYTPRCARQLFVAPISLPATSPPVETLLPRTWFRDWPSRCLRARRFAGCS